MNVRGQGLILYCASPTPVAGTSGPAWIWANRTAYSVNDSARLLTPGLHALAAASPDVVRATGFDPLSIDQDVQRVIVAKQ